MHEIWRPSTSQSALWWHPQTPHEVPGLTLIGQYAQAYNFHEKGSGKVTERVRHFKLILQPIPLVHLFPRNQTWMAKILGLEAEVVPELQTCFQEIIQKQRRA